MKYIKLSLLFVLIISASGCKKLLDINSDPASPQTSRAEFYLAPIIASLAQGIGQDIRSVQLKYTQNIGTQLTNDRVAESHGWVSADSFGGVMWRFVYINAGLNLEDMMTKAKADGNNTLVGIAYAIKAYGFQFLTDSHGPVILDEAFKDQLYFTYQDQPEVYAKVEEWAQLSLKYLNTPDNADFYGVLKNNDYLFGRSVTNDLAGYRGRWKKFVSALLATHYSHLINKPEFASKYADSVVKYVDQSFGATVMNASEDATIGYDGTLPANSNPFSTTGNYLSTNLVGQPVISYMTGGMRGTPALAPTSSIDPRLSRMVNPINTPTVPSTNGVYRGVVATKGDVPTVKTIPGVYGAAIQTAANPYPGKYIFGLSTDQNSRFPLFTFAQLQFAKAEALFIKGNKGDAFIAYNNGIRGHMDFVNRFGRNGAVIPPVISAAEINAYMTSTEVAQNSGQLTIADIMGQKYVAQWGWAGQEQWCDLRKYHYDPTVFTQFKQLETSESSFTIGGVPQYAYRLRPRFNSEYVWNIKELEKWGATLPTYSYKETWFSLPN